MLGQYTRCSTEAFGEYINGICQMRMKCQAALNAENEMAKPKKELSKNEITIKRKKNQSRNKNKF